eukprot:303894_1
MATHKGIRNDRIIECSRCSKHMCWKQIDEHWILYQNGGRGHPKHIQNAATVKYYELENGKAIKTKSIMAMFGFKCKDKNDEQSLHRQGVYVGEMSQSAVRVPSFEQFVSEQLRKEFHG